MVIIITYIRTDANETIATGHVMRCITISKILKSKGMQVCFVVSDENSTKMIRQNGYDLIVLNTDWKVLNEKYEYDFFKRIKAEGILIIDTYSATDKYVDTMSRIFKVAVFDDLFKEYYSAQIIINYNLYYPIFDYYNRYKDVDVKLLLGDKYVPLRSEFMKIEQNNRDSSRIEKIMMVCGGGDILNSMYKILTYIRQEKIQLFMSVEWEIIVGAYNSNIGCLKQLAEEYDNIELKINVNNIAEIMSESDLCISAASTVLYECSAMQLPTIFYCTSDDQIYDVKSFGNGRGMLYAGDFRNDEIETINKIVEYLSKLTNDSIDYLNMLDEAKNSVNKNGAENIVSEIIKLV